MGRSLAAGLFAAFAGCVGEGSFITNLADAECARWLECASDPVLTFYGWDGQDDCVADKGPEIAALGAECEYDAKAARACVEETELATCPADGDEIARPASCEAVYLCE